MFSQLITILAVLVLYFFLYYMTGSLALHFLPVGEMDDRLSRRLVLGFFVYHSLFTIIALPMKLTLQPLSRLSALWCGCLAILLVLFLIFESKASLTRIKKLFYDASLRGRSNAAAFLLLMAVILIQTVWFNLNDETFALWDQSYYIGDTATSLYTDTISQYNPYTGNQLDCLNKEYLLETYQNHSSVMCRLLHIHPLIEVRTVMASVVLILYQLLFYEIGMVLFRRDRLKSAVMVWFLFLLNLFSFNLFTAGEFLIIRPFEGKTILAVLIIPGLLWLFLQTASDPDNRTYWIHTLLMILGSFGLNMSAIYMIPFEISAFYIPLAIRKKKPSVFLRYLLLLIPCAVFAVMYLITRHYVTFYIGK